MPPGRGRSPGAVDLEWLRCATLSEGHICYTEILDEPHQPCLSYGLSMSGSAIGAGKAPMFCGTPEPPGCLGHRLPSFIRTMSRRSSTSFLLPAYTVDLRLCCIIAEMTFDVHAPLQVSLSSRLVVVGMRLLV